MFNVARGNSVDTVASEDGTGFCCGSPATHSTDKCSKTVFVNNIGVVRQTDTMIPHLTAVGGCCVEHKPPMVKCSTLVFVEKLGLARLNDIYILGVNHVVSSGSPNTFDGSPSGFPVYTGG